MAPVAAAIALAESGGCTSALNLTDNNGTQTSVGLWQVSNGTHQYPASWTSASGNATEAVAKYQAADGFSPWGTYDSGAYEAFLNGSTTPDTNVPGSGTNSGSGSGSSTTTGSTSAACLVGFPGFSIPVLGKVGDACVISKSEARAIIGGALMIMSAGGALVGLLILAAAGLGRSGALGKAADAASVVPGGIVVAEGLRTADRRSRGRATRRARPAGTPPAVTAAPEKRQPTEAEVRASLAARGNQLAPRVNTG